MNERIDQSPPIEEILAPAPEVTEVLGGFPELPFGPLEPLEPFDTRGPGESLQPPPALLPLLDHADYADYAQASDSSLRRAEVHELSQFLTADLGHFILKGLVLARQIIALLRGEEVTLAWDPDVVGINPDLDEKKRQANEQLQAIWREQSLRRSIRQQLRDQ